MRDVTKCQYGHYFDQKIYGSCPHCARGMQRTGSTMEYKQRISGLALQYLEQYRREQEKKREAPEPVRQEREVSARTGKAEERSYLVTGWLVCTEGTEAGYTYSLHPGENSVCGCSVSYEETRNRFYVTPSRDKRASLNGEELLGSELLQTGDELLIDGNCFEFIAWCRGRRKWSGLSDKEGKGGFDHELSAVYELLSPEGRL